MEAASPVCFSCYVAWLESSANSFGYTLQPLIPISMNLPVEYHIFFIRLNEHCASILREKKWETLPQIDQVPYQTTVHALKEDFEKLLNIGMQPKTEDGTQRVIALMRQIKNLITLLNSISADI